MDISEFQEGDEVVVDDLEGEVVEAGTQKDLNFLLFKVHRPDTDWDWHYFRVEKYEGKKPVLYPLDEVIEGRTVEVNEK